MVGITELAPKLDFGQYDLIGHLPSLTSIILPRLQLCPQTLQACHLSHHFLIYAGTG